jgi:hypothetical protein
MTLDWDYQAGHVDISMPGYSEKALQKFTHSKPTRAQYAPSKWTPIIYGAPVQYTDPEDTSLPLDTDGITKLQQIIGTLLYYSRAVNNTMLVALGTLASAQSQATTQIMEAAISLLNYAATHTADATIQVP